MRIEVAGLEVGAAYVIFHASIPADNPERVARVFAELWQAEVFPFVFPGSLVVIPGNAHGTMVEIVPRGDEQVPAAVEVGIRRNVEASTYNEVHLNVGTALSEAEIFALAGREGWIARKCDRAAFNLIELWIENRFLIELMPEMEAERYAAFYSDPNNWREAIKHQPMPMPQFGYAEEWLAGP